MYTIQKRTFNSIKKCEGIRILAVNKSRTESTLTTGLPSNGESTVVAASRG